MAESVSLRLAPRLETGGPGRGLAASPPGQNQLFLGYPSGPGFCRFWTAQNGKNGKSSVLLRKNASFFCKKSHFGGPGFRVSCGFTAKNVLFLPFFIKKNTIFYQGTFWSKNRSRLDHFLTFRFWEVCNFRTCEKSNFLFSLENSKKKTQKMLPYTFSCLSGTPNQKGPNPKSLPRRYYLDTTGVWRGSKNSCF